MIFKSLKTKVFFCTHFFLKKTPEARLIPNSPSINPTTMRIFIGSWNVGHAKCPSQQTIEHWIKQAAGYQVIALGVQECKKTRKSDWLSTIKEHVEKNGYTLISYVPMWEMFLLVFVKHELKHRITALETKHKAKGFIGLIGNKGGVYTTLKID
jgi:hypothetical protein